MKLDKPKPYRIKLRDGRILPLTEVKGEKIRNLLSDRNVKWIDITDDNGNFEETLEKKQIIGIEYKTLRSDVKRFCCDYGRYHHEGEECKCHNDFKNMSGIKFWRIAKEKGHNIRYNEDITDDVRASVQQWIRETGYDNTVKRDPKEMITLARKIFQ